MEVSRCRTCSQRSQCRSTATSPARTTGSGPDEALRRAREAAGEQNVVVMGGGDVLRQCLDAGIVDELALTVAPILIGSGKRLFDGIERTDLGFERIDVVESPFATHIRYRVNA